MYSDYARNSVHWTISNMFVSFVFIFAVVLTESSYASRLICYYGSWSVYRYGLGKFEVKDIDPNLCTHIVYTFGGIDEEGTVRALDPWNDVGDDWHEGAFKKLMKLRKSNKRLKLIFAVGGWNEGSEKYSRVLRNPQSRNNFVNSALNFTLTHGFDGFDLDWEYPTLRGGHPSDKDNFSLVIKNLAAAFQKYNLILSAAVTGNSLNIAKSYDCREISKYLSFINVMSYDLHGPWESVTGHHTALYPHSTDKVNNTHLNVNSAIEGWINCGAEPFKLHLGVAAYGRTFTLANAKNHGIGVPSNGPGKAGKFVPENGFLPYNEICFEQNSGLWNVYYDAEQRVPYSVKGNLWVGYDDPKSITKKVELAKKYNLGGIMIWSIETDDFKNICGFGRYPLLNAINKALL